ncbi:prenyltransferase [Nesterenkonia sp. CL21]|uniref:prenyltransferase n=1 Tax=Nesterenkonia sp. CL21 TaxID=3064894 RepID=UPI00287952D7|nr:prenyltransferase [Nesterenkonia sp. CL21]MDS2172290.1 prenyltransferase [Nesterenkonia sp. CL21]
MTADLLRASRPLSWINTAYPFAAAWLLAGGGLDPALIIGTVFFLVPYNLALYGINDVYDHASDLANPRKGGAEGALLDVRRHRPLLVISAALVLPFVVVLVILGGPSSWMVLGVSLVALVAYSAPPLRTKEVPVLDSLTSSLHFVTPAAYGLALAGADVDAVVVCALGAFLLWGMASHAFGAVQDIGPDRAAGISSIGTVFGARRTVRFALALWAAAGVIVIGTGWPGALAGLLVLPYIALALPYRSIGDAEAAQAHRGWRHFLLLNYAVGAALTILLIQAT